ncbi:hypothetical protein TMatcc_005714 [Talaromyces marneffei ATCC 18224]
MEVSKSRKDLNLNAKIALSFTRSVSADQLKLRLRTNKAVVRRALGGANQQPPRGHPMSKPLLETLDRIESVILQNIPFHADVQGQVRRMRIVMPRKVIQAVHSNNTLIGLHRHCGKGCTE